MDLRTFLKHSPIEATRRNHGLEHATVAVLLERWGYRRSIAGRSTPFGFYIYGAVDQDDLSSAVDEALDRLQRGAAHWAVSPFCGTNLAVAGFLAAASVLAVSRQRTQRDAFPNAVLAATVAVLAAQPLGALAQRYVTTSADLLGTRVVEVREVPSGLMKTHYVRTERVA